MICKYRYNSTEWTVKRYQTHYASVIVQSLTSQTAFSQKFLALVGRSANSVHATTTMPIDTAVSLSGLFCRKVDKGIVGAKRVLASRPAGLGRLTTLPMSVSLASRQRPCVDVV